MVKGITQFVILRTPFLNMIQPIERIDSEGITTTLNSQEIIL